MPVDALTGLPNARRFREELEREHGRSSRAWDSYGIVRIDVDGMQAINDELGVPIGDAVLERVSECLDGCRREYDMVARYEATSSSVLLPGADRVAVEAVATRMVTAVARARLRARRRAAGSPRAPAACVWVPPSGENGRGHPAPRAGMRSRTRRGRGGAGWRLTSRRRDWLSAIGTRTCSHCTSVKTACSPRRRCPRCRTR